MLKGTSVATGEIAASFASGKSIDEVMADYELSCQQVEAALRWELLDRIWIKAVVIVVICAAMLGIVLHF